MKYKWGFTYSPKEWVLRHLCGEDGEDCDGYPYSRDFNPKNYVSQIQEACKELEAEGLIARSEMYYTTEKGLEAKKMLKDE